VATLRQRGNSALALSTAANGILDEALLGALAWRPDGNSSPRPVLTTPLPMHCVLDIGCGDEE